MIPVPFDRSRIGDIITRLNLDLKTAQIREINMLINEVEAAFGARYIRMEMGVPGLPAPSIAVEAEIEALREGVINQYAPFEGLAELKQAGADFAKAFMDLDVPPASVIPTNGAMQACFLAQGLAGCHRPDRDTILFLDPGFPVNKLQANMLGLKTINLDLADFRGPDLCRRVDELCTQYPVGGCLWSSPNNPAWVVLDEEELKGLAEVLTKHQVFAIEDLAYFGMDFRYDYSVPYQPPFQPTIARYMDEVFVIVSSSKLFSYAGQRCGLAIIPPKFAERAYPHLAKRFARPRIINAFLQGGLNPTSASIARAPQRGLAALLRATVEGRYNPFEAVQVYGRRAQLMKQCFIDSGFYLPYDGDRGKPLADGFYFTIAYPGMDGADLARELIYYGISAITLEVTGSGRTEGLRACVSLTEESRFDELRYRLTRFREDHPTT